MSLIDQLEREAAAARARREAEEARREAHDADAQARLQPALQRIEAYFREFSTHLRELDRPRTVDFDLGEGRRLQGLQQSGFRAGWVEQGGRRRFQLTCRCVGRRPTTLRLSGEPQVAAAERRLRAAGLRTRRQHGATTLTVEPEVPVTLAFEAEAGRTTVVFTERNLLELGERAHRLEASRVDDALLDAIGHMLLGERATFDQLMGNRVDETQRRLMARRLAREQRRREAELGGPLRRACFPVAEWFRRTFLGR